MDHNGVEMKFQMVVKDHFTKLTWLRPIKSKESIHVKWELEHLYCEWGFPMIHQTDNGTEFVSNLVNQLFEEHPMAYSVTRAPYHPQTQGSVERTNQEVKKIISKMIIEEKSRLGLDSNPSWVKMIPRATSALNNSCSYGHGNLTPYEHVFGLNFDCPYVKISSEHRNKVKTVDDLSNYSSKHEGLAEELRSQGFDIDRVKKKKQEVNARKGKGMY